ncbi:hypothetical protein CCHL11_03131 [Colletotrichum chlorophyti]|uniref:Chromo domain-containing protein n=1 Tax=Colletotrichum chlorophyti TaxID=708187 RepID=A0A1Q8RGK9_9PEZI|nr:hypothetical protein CCHL11_03131 [Colletotrichum chlorophyti]
MARLNESPAPPSGAESAKKPQLPLKNGAVANSLLSSPVRAAESLSPHPSKRQKSRATTGTPRSEASRSPSPPTASPHIQANSLPSKTLNQKTPADDMDVEVAGTPADPPTATTAEKQPVDSASTPTPTAPTADMGLVPEAQVGDAPVSDIVESTPEPSVPRAGVLTSVKKSFKTAVNNLTGQRGGSTTVTSTFEQTVVSRKRSREPEADGTPAPAVDEETKEAEPDKDAEAPNVTLDVNDTTIQLGNQLDADVVAEEARAKSPVKEAVQVAAAEPTADAEINVATPDDNADTVAAASTEAVPVREDEDEDMDDPKNGVFVLDKIIGHRRDPKDETLFHMQVSWKNDDPTWEPEQIIQEDAAEALFAYWDSVKGGRLGAMTDKGLWHVLKIEKHRKKPSGAVEFLVYWIGSRDRSWEPERQVEQYARQHVADYWTSKGGRSNFVKPPAAVPAKRGRGRPRKNTVPDDVEAPVEAHEEISTGPKEKRGRAAQKQKDAEKDELPVDKADKATAAEEGSKKQDKAEPAEIDEEPPKKRGRGRPRRNPVS